MKPINIYALTRLNKPELLSRMEKQMSGRERPMKIRTWEIDGLRQFSDRLQGIMYDACFLMFYYSFTMQKLGKEFDLLRISDDCIVDIELKSRDVSDEVIRSQLMQNKYYISTLGKTMYFYTYISGPDKLVRLTNSGRLVESSFEELAILLERQGGCMNGDIEDLFKEDKYLISPITDPGHFLRQEYFLTFQQRDIKKQILGSIQGGHMIQGFTGLPGTGKTILLYDIAMSMSHKNSVCVLHFGPHRKELMQLDERLKRIDFYYCVKNGIPDIPKRYAAIFVDEGHGMGGEALSEILHYSREWDAPVVISYDNVDCISEKERSGLGAPVIEACEDFKGYKLTNKIRLNNELSTFLRKLFLASSVYKREYPSVTVSFGKDRNECDNLIRFHEKEGYMFIWDKTLGIDYDEKETFPGEALTRIESGNVTGKEFEKVVMILDESFYYDEHGFLRNRESDLGGNTVRIMNLFHGLSRAGKKIALVIEGNMELLERIYHILQK
ncbi:MAG: ATP-binding protein [Lachnospiraceae bacterium]|nr:ATP-binding protein [Lachnospiraceae bacterium]